MNEYYARIDREIEYLAKFYQDKANINDIFDQLERVEIILDQASADLQRIEGSLPTSDRDADSVRAKAGFYALLFRLRAKAARDFLGPDFGPGIRVGVEGEE